MARPLLAWVFEQVLGALFPSPLPLPYISVQAWTTEESGWILSPGGSNYRIFLCFTNTLMTSPSPHHIVFRSTLGAVSFFWTGLVVFAKGFLVQILDEPAYEV